MLFKKKKSAFVVDTDASSKKIVTDHLKNLNLNVHHFSCGQEAWEQLAKTKTDVQIVVSAVRLFPGEGLTLLEKIRSHELLWQIPVILVDQDYDPLLAKDARRFDVHDYLLKPISPVGFTESLNRIAFSKNFKHSA